MGCRDMAAMSLWFLGYPDQALKRIQEALTLGHELSHPYSLGHALAFAALLHLFRREGQLAQEKAEALIALAREHEFAWWLAGGITLRGWALAEQGQEEEGIAQLRQGLDAGQATGAELDWPMFLALLAEAHGKMGQVEEGLKVLDEAIAVMLKNENRSHEAELYRLKGELTLKQSTVHGSQSEKSRVGIAHHDGTVAEAVTVGGAHPTEEEEAEACFHKAIEVARRQQAKSLELRAAMSLSRLWQKQGRKEEARKMLAEIYNWFIEGFDTKDLQEAKALLDEL
jgi:predicted ATPase